MLKTQVQFLFNENIVAYIFVGLLGFGLLLRFILELIYVHMVKESENLGSAKRKSLKHMKMKFETCYKLKIGVNNVDIFVDKNVLRFRFCGAMLSTWENISGQILLLNFLIVPICAVFGVYFDCGQDQILTAGGVGILSASILVLVDKMINLPFKKQILRVNIVDYLENFCKVRLEQEAFHPELLEQYRREYFDITADDSELGSFSAQGKEATKKEINRRKEARKQKEEEKRRQALLKQEEEKRIEQARKEEEQRRAEERRLLAAKRREEELRRMQEEQEAIERRKAELKKKSEEKLTQVFSSASEKSMEREMRASKSHEEEKLELLRRLEEELLNAKRNDKLQQKAKEILETKEEEEFSYDMVMPETAAAKEETSVEVDSSMKKNMEQRINETIESRSLTAQEEKLIEDILKEFFA